MGLVAGLLHDLGKYSREFQARLEGLSDPVTIRPRARSRRANDGMDGGGRSSSWLEGTTPALPVAERRTVGVYLCTTA